MSDWLRDKAAGEVEEDNALRWLKGIDFSNLEKITLRSTKGIDNGREYGYFVRTCPQDRQEWILTRAIGRNNENRDYIVQYPDGKREKHEIKAQFRTYGDVPGYGAHTTNICIEVDAGSVINADRYKIKEERAWYHPGDGTDKNGNPYHADWYHHVMPLYKRDGAEIDPRTKMCIRELSDTEKAEYMSKIQPGENIITEMPGGIILTVSGEKTQDIIEKYAYPEMRLNPDGERTNKKIIALVPVKSIIDGEIQCDQYDGETAITPTCVFDTKQGAESTNHFFMPSVLFESITEQWKYIGEKEIRTIAAKIVDEKTKALFDLCAELGSTITFTRTDTEQLEEMKKAYWNYYLGVLQMPIDPIKVYANLPMI